MKAVDGEEWLSVWAVESEHHMRYNFNVVTDKHAKSNDDRTAITCNVLGITREFFACVQSYLAGWVSVRCRVQAVVVCRKAVLILHKNQTITHALSFYHSMSAMVAHLTTNRALFGPRTLKNCYRFRHIVGVGTSMNKVPVPATAALSK